MAEDLRVEKVGKKEFFFYCLFFILTTGFFAVFETLQFLGLRFTGSYYYESVFFETIYWAVSLLSFLPVFVIPYYTNKAGDGKRFWYRFLSLDFPVNLVTWVFFFVVYFVTGIFGLVNSETFNYYDLFFIIAADAIYFYLIWKYMKSIASGK